MKCYANKCEEEAKYLKNIIVKAGFVVEIKVCEEHYLKFIPYAHMVTKEKIKEILSCAIKV